MDGVNYGASYAGVSVQACMIHPRHLLQMLSLPWYTNGRATTDFKIDSKNLWPFGFIAPLFNALKMKPSKDVFWSTGPKQPGSDGGVGDDYHPNPLLHVITAVLSTGPVGIGDGPSYTDATLVNRCCDASGTVLAPSLAPAAIDATYALDPTERLSGTIWSSSSNISTGSNSDTLQWQLLVANVTNGYSFGPAELVPKPPVMYLHDLWYREAEVTAGSQAASDCADGATSGCIAPANSKVELRTGQIHANGTVPSRLLHFMPVLGNRWVLVGETSKIVGVSPRRMYDV